MNSMYAHGPDLKLVPRKKEVMYQSYTFKVGDREICHVPHLTVKPETRDIALTNGKIMVIWVLIIEHLIIAICSSKSKAVWLVLLNTMLMHQWVATGKQPVKTAQQLCTPFGLHFILSLPELAY